MTTDPRACRRLRDELLTADPFSELSEAQRRHLAECDACHRFAERSAGLVGALAAPRSEPRPDAGFAARVVARLPAEDNRARARFTWAAVRLLPAATALLLVLLGWSLLAPSDDPLAGPLTSPLTGSASGAATDTDLLTWILDESPGGGGQEGS